VRSRRTSSFFSTIALRHIVRRGLPGVLVVFAGQPHHRWVGCWILVVPPGDLASPAVFFASGLGGRVFILLLIPWLSFIFKEWAQPGDVGLVGRGEWGCG
jgi:hypothetical protein